MFNGFEPVFNKNSRVLILGSFPSVKSRENGFYYGNKQNRFWRMLGKIFNEEIKDDINFKTTFLLIHNIALFDVVTESDLSGSADVSLEKSNHKVADFEFLLPPHTKIEKILCNGKTAYNLFLEKCKTSLPVICMSSTSSANPRFDIEDWKSELEFLIKWFDPLSCT